MSVQLKDKMLKQSILAMALVIGIGYGCTHKTEEIKPADNATISSPQKQFEWKNTIHVFESKVYIFNHMQLNLETLSKNLGPYK